LTPFRPMPTGKGEFDMKLHRLATLVVLITLALLIISCGEQKPATTVQEAKEEVKELTQATVKTIDEKQLQYIQQVKETVNLYSRRLIRIDKKISILSEQAQADMKAELENFRTRRNEVAGLLGELHDEQAEAWEEVKKEVEKAMVDMDRAYEVALRRMP